MTLNNKVRNLTHFMTLRLQFFFCFAIIFFPSKCQRINSLILLSRNNFVTIFQIIKTSIIIIRLRIVDQTYEEFHNEWSIELNYCWSLQCELIKVVRCFKFLWACASFYIETEWSTSQQSRMRFSFPKRRVLLWSTTTTAIMPTAFRVYGQHLLWSRQIIVIFFLSLSDLIILHRIIFLWYCSKLTLSGVELLHFEEKN